AVDDVSIFSSGIEIDPDGEAAEIEKRFHLRADARGQAKNGAAGPGNFESGQAVAQRRPECDVIIREVVRFELRLLMFQIRLVGFVAAILQRLLRRVPRFAKFAEENALANRALEPREKSERIESALFFPAHWKHSRTVLAISNREFARRVP